MTENSILVARVETESDLESCFDIRKRVFVDEQGVTEREEYDGLDDQCLHYLLKLDGASIGTARLRVLDGKAKVQRVAVLKAARGAGLGAALMRRMLDDARGQGIETAILSAQISAIPFYERLGFVAHGPEYMDAGIPHRDMTLTL